MTYLLALLSITGIAISYYIYYSKKHNRNLICPIGHDCNEVVKSKYGKTFGIENALLGIMFYAIVLAYSIMLAANRNIFKDALHYAILAASVLSAGFAVYLAAVQAFVLKKWCDYCIASSIISVIIMIALAFMN